MALNRINADGADGYHWRVRVDEKTSSDGSGNTKVLAYSWWDIQDENAKLPAKEVSLTELSSMFGSPSHSAASSGGSGAGSTTDDMTKAATGAIRSLGKTLNKAVAGTVDHHGTPGHDHGPRVSVIAFKLTEISKMFDKAGGRSGSRGAGRVVFPKRAAPPAQRQRPPAAAAAAAAAVCFGTCSQQRAPAPAAPAARRQTAAASVPRATPPAQRQASADLMGFGSEHSAAATARRRGVTSTSSAQTCHVVSRRLPQRNSRSTSETRIRGQEADGQSSVGRRRSALGRGRCQGRVDGTSG